MRWIGLWAAGALAVLAGGVAAADDSAAIKQLTPTGKLRVAVAISPAPSALYAVKDAGSGKLKGITVDLAEALASKLGVAIEWREFLGSGEIQNSAGQNVWDVTFMPVDEERKKFVDFGNAYHILQSTYLVAPGTGLNGLADVNRAGVRVAGVVDTATFRASNKASPNATHVPLAGVDAAIELMRSGGAEAIALSRESLSSIATKIPGSRILDGGFMNSTTAIAVPKGRTDALGYATAFIEEAKASGLVRRGFDAVGLTVAQVAPAGMKP
jgi:polar amino acid transport system substrate-binding protein